MTPLRQKLIDEIQLRGFSIHTQRAYVRSVAGLAQFYDRSPDKIADDEINAYLLHLLRIKKLAVSSIIVAVSALRFFFGQVLRRPTEAIEKALPTMKKPILRPRVYSSIGRHHLPRRHWLCILARSGLWSRGRIGCSSRLARMTAGRRSRQAVATNCPFCPSPALAMVPPIACRNQNGPPR